MEASQAHVVHTGELSMLQKARLFTGSLPDYICIDVELHEPQDLQHAMRLVRAYKRCNAPLLPWSTRYAMGGQATLSAPLTSTGPSLTTPSASSTSRPFKHLTPEEMAEHRKMGLCYNCNEPYVQGHKCAQLFYLEALNYIIEESDDATNDVAAAPPLTPFDLEKPMISLSAITGIRA